MIAYTGENEQILTADGLADLRFGFTASETGHIHVYEIVALDIAVKGRIVFTLSLWILLRNSTM